MLVNLTGPPCSGKSLFASRFMEEYPEFQHLSIDAYRIQHKDEDSAWYELMCDAAAAKHAILETSGLSWHIEAHFLQHPVTRRRGILTIVLYGNEEDFQERLRVRESQKEKPAIPFKYKGLTLKSLVRKCLEILPEKYPTAYFLCTDNTGNTEEQYTEFKEVILKKEKKLKKFLNG